MTRLARLCRRSPADRTLLVHAALLHLTVAVSIRVCRTSRVMRMLTRLYQPTNVAAPQGAGDRIAWAIQTATYALPLWRTCLSEALTAQLLFLRSGIPSTVRFGVASAPGAQTFAAHAWLECAGRVVIGGDITTFQPLRHAQAHR